MHHKISIPAIDRSEIQVGYFITRQAVNWKVDDHLIISCPGDGTTTIHKILGVYTWNQMPESVVKEFNPSIKAGEYLVTLSKEA